MSSPIYLDITRVPDYACDCAIHALHKAMSEGDGSDGVWRPAENPFVRELIERFTQRGLTQIEGVRGELNEWLAGKHHSPGERQQRPLATGRWSAQESSLVKLYLERLPTAEYAPEDWSLLVDYIAQRYLPAGFATDSAQWMAAKSTTMGKVEAALSNADSTSQPSQTDITRVMDAVPGSGTAAKIGLGVLEQSIMRFAVARTAENIASVSDGLRHRMKSVILAHEEAKALGDSSATPQKLEQTLSESFATANRDWRRIALTEGVENANQGFLAHVGKGGKVRRLEKYQDACSFCRSIDGKVFNVVDAGDPDKNGYTDVWVGKTNIGRSLASRRRVGGALIERGEDERYWPAAGVQHPHCRGSWVIVGRVETAGDAKFTNWMQSVLKKPGS